MLTVDLATIGQSVTPSQPLAVIQPDGAALQVHLFAPSRAVGFVKPDDRVNLRYQAFPYQKFGQQDGRVRSIARTALSATELASLNLPQQDQNEPLYRIVVEPRRQAIEVYGRQTPLQAGMTVDAYVLQETRAIYEWMLEPLLSVNSVSSRCPAEQPMRIESKPAGRRLARGMSRMNSSLRALARSARARVGAITASVSQGGLASGLAAWNGRSMRMPQAPAWLRSRMNQISAAASGRDWPWPLQSIRTAAGRLRAAVAWLATDCKDGSRGGLEQISERLNFGFARKLPVLRQTEAAECGLVCLAMVASFFGLRTDPAAIRSRHATSNRGLTLANLMKMASPLGLSTRAVRLDVADLDKLRLPAVLHWNLDHFVVLRQITRKGLRIHDPATGERLIPWAEVDKAFSGIALELWPSTEFAKGDERRRIGLFDVTGRINGAVGYLLNLVAIGVLLELLAILVPFFTQWAMDNVVALGDADLLTLLAVGMTIVLLLQLVFTTFRGWFITYTSSTFSLQWKSSVLAHMVRLPLAWFQTRHLGDIVSKFHATDAIAGALNTMFVESMFDGVMSFVTLGLMALYSWKLCLIAAAIMLLYATFRALQVLPYRRALEEGIIAGARLELHLMETIRGVRTIKLFLQEDGRKTEWLSLAVDATNAAVRTQRLKLLYRTANGFMGSLERVLIFWLGMKAVIDHEMTLGAITAFIAYKDQFYGRVTSLIDNFIELRLLGTQVDRLADIVLTSTEHRKERDAT